jgi:hypothetical protein
MKRHGPLQTHPQNHRPSLKTFTLQPQVSRLWGPASKRLEPKDTGTRLTVFFSCQLCTILDLHATVPISIDFVGRECTGRAVVEENTVPMIGVDFIFADCHVCLLPADFHARKKVVANDIFLVCAEPPVKNADTTSSEAPLDLPFAATSRITHTLDNRPRRVQPQGYIKGHKRAI